MRILEVLKLTSLLICLLMLFSFFVTGEAIAVDYYVSIAGNDSNPGTNASPFKTIQKAANVANPGDTVIVGDGVYTDTNGDGNIVSIERAGTSTQWITFRTSNKWGAILDGQNNTTENCWVLGANASYIRIEGFEIKGCGSHGFVTQSANNIYIYRNKVHDIGRRLTESLYGQTGSYVGASAHHITYDSNIFHTIGRLPHGTFSWVDYNHDHGLYLRGDNITIVNNIFYGCKSGWPILVDDVSTGHKIINNTLYDANPYEDGHIVVIGNDKTIDINNNISHSATKSFIYFYYSNGGTVRITNNLAYGAANVVTYAPNIPSYTSANNITNQDPQIVDLAKSDFHLKSTSPAIDKGANVGISYDADGNAIVGVRDIGAYEYVVPPPPTPSPTPGAPTLNP